MFDDAWRAAVARGRTPREVGGEGDRQAGSDASNRAGAVQQAFLDALAALVADEKDRLKDEWAQGRPSQGATDAEQVAGQLEELRFELGEMRGRLESLESMLGGLLARIDAISPPSGRRTVGHGER